MNECRICLEDDEVENMISPCRCSGTGGYVHEQCLQKWRQECIGNPEKYNKCELCKEKYVIIRENLPETCFILKIYPRSAQYWLGLITIWVTAVSIGIIDFATNFPTLRITVKSNITGRMRTALTQNTWSAISYYQSMAGFLFSLTVLLFTKLFSIRLVHQQCRYQREMLWEDFNYFLSLLTYPLLLLISYDLGDVGLLCSAGAFTILVNVPCTYIYLKGHNKILLKINARYCKEKILNTTYNPTYNITYNQVLTHEITAEPSNYDILEMI